jgi:predicted extracellular nuclease
MINETNRMKTLLLLCLLSFALSFSEAQNTGSFGDTPRGEKGIRVMCYNVENLFDIWDDTLKNDADFLPNGSNHWTWKRYQDKLRKIAQNIRAVGGWEMPELIGLCEIENLNVLKALVKHPTIQPANYQIVHFESPDERGVDVACLYRPDKIDILGMQPIKVVFPIGERPTRDILYVKALVLKKDTLHFFVNHWSSRLGGMTASEPKRMIAAQVVRHAVDSIFAQNSLANIVITGDFNDEPENKSLSQTLKAHHKEDDLKDQDLFNLMYEKIWKEGTHKFDGKWGILDQFIVSTSLLKGKSALSITPDRAKVFKKDWLLVRETKEIGDKPFRTYQGPKYLGGYSDHLPIYLDVAVKF